MSRLKAAIEDEDLLAAIYGSLMAHEVSAEFSAKHFNPKGEATEIMTRLQGSGARVIAETLTERLADKGIRAIRQDTLFDYATRELRVNPEMLRHLLPEMKLNKQMAKWGGKDYVRVIWVTEGSRVERGVVHFEDGGSQDLVEHLQIDLNSGFAAVACNA